LLYKEAVFSAISFIKEGVIILFKIQFKIKSSSSSLRYE